MTIDGGLRPLFRQHLSRGVHWQSVETGGTGLGCPDSNYCVEPGFEGWIEYKQTAGWDVTLRPEQVGWLVKRRAMGGRALVAVRRWHDGGPRKGDPVDQLWIFDGRWARELKTGGLSGADHLAAWDGGPSAWDWDYVRRLMCA